MALALHQGNFENISVQIIIHIGLHGFLYSINVLVKFLVFHLRVCNPESKASIGYGEPCSQFSKNTHRRSSYNDII